MYRVMLVFDSKELLEDVRKLRIWGEKSEFEIVTVVHDGNSAYQEMKKQKYDLIITEISIRGMDCLKLLRKASSEHLCDHMIFCSENPDFEYARQGMILGAFDYAVKPFDETQFFSMFRRIKNKVNTGIAYEVFYVDELLLYFENHDHNIYECIDKMFLKIYRSEKGELFSDKIVRQIYRNVVKEVFARNEWMDLYFSLEDFDDEHVIIEASSDSYKMYYRNKLIELFEKYEELFPNIHNDKIGEVILYILYNPESDLKQKTIADNLCINNSYLSTVFSAHTDIRFVDYLTLVKMKRAGWLLRETDLKVAEISSRLYYKDTGYFSRLFKKQYGLTPSEYRVPDNYIFHI